MSIGIAVDPATAFEVFTGEIGRWWSRKRDVGTGRMPARGTLRFEPGVGGRLLEVYDEAAGDVFEIGRVRLWEKGEQASRLVFEWRQGNYEPDQVTEVEVRFEPTPGGTRVTLEHRGLGVLPLDHGARHDLGDGAAFREMMEDWWGGLLERAKALAEQPS